MSLVRGESEPELRTITLGQMLRQQASDFPLHNAIICSWTGSKITYQQLLERSHTIAKGLIALGVGPGDRVGILSGNCERYLELFLGTTHIGAIFVLLNNTYTPEECQNALEHSGNSLLLPRVGIILTGFLNIQVAQYSSPLVPLAART